MTVMVLCQLEKNISKEMIHIQRCWMNNFNKPINFFLASSDQNIEQLLAPCILWSGVLDESGVKFWTPLHRIHGGTAVGVPERIF